MSSPRTTTATGQAAGRRRRHNGRVTDAPASDVHTSPQTLLLCDLVGSTALVNRLGDARAAALMRRHDQLARAELKRHGGIEIDKTDGFLLLFEQPGRAVCFALAYQRALREAGVEYGVRLRARVALHADQLRSWSNSAQDVARGAKPTDIAGLARVVLGQVLALARPGQILMTQAVADPARQQSGHPAAGIDRMRWCDHGVFRLRALPQPQRLFEVREPGLAPLRPPSLLARPPRQIVQRLRWPLAALGMLVVALGLLAGWALQPEAETAFAERDWVVMGALQNDSDRPELSAALETVLRIGLQQSQHINVIPPARVDDTLRRMRQPDGAAVDRDIGRQLALREGARALLLPSLSRVDGGFRIAAELIEPGSGVSVFGASELAADEAGLLAAADRLLGRLRSGMGESLAAIAESSGPLEQITTGNLDALIALAEAERAYARGAGEQSIALFDQALALDPEFAMALARRGLIELNQLERPDLAAASWRQALSLSQHLSDGERRWVEAMQALAFGTPEEAVASWSAYAQRHPESASGHHNLAVALRQRERALGPAIHAAQRSATSRHPMRSYSWLLLGELRLETGDVEAAREAFAQATALGQDSAQFTAVLPDLVERKHAAVTAQLDAARGLTPRRALEQALRRAAVAADQGRLHEALAVLDAIEAADLPLRTRARIDLQRIALLLALGDPAADAALASMLELHRQRVEALDPLLDRSLLLHASAAALLAARHGHDSHAARLLQAAESLGDWSGHHVEPAFLRLAACHVHQPPAARVACLQPLLDGREYFQMRVAHADALLASGQPRLALEAARAVLAHRSAAVAELEGWPLQVPNLIDANRAYLLLAEAALQLDEPATAAAALDAFEAHWSGASQALPMVATLRRLRGRVVDYQGHH
jgi:putative peptide modification system cyclase